MKYRQVLYISTLYAHFAFCLFVLLVFRGVYVRFGNHGKIKIAYHGQQATVVPETMTEAQPEIMEQINPLSEPIPLNDESTITTMGDERGYATTDQINSKEIR
jgi:hypothetical protein